MTTTPTPAPMPEPKREPCAGKNCGSSIDRLHSAECFAEHETCIAQASAARVPSDATPGPYSIHYEPVSSWLHATQELAKLAQGTDGFSGVLPMIVAGNGLCIAVTGCGPDGRKNAEAIRALLASSSGGSDSQTLIDAYALGWHACSSWAERDDLLADIGSPAYIAEREKMLAGLSTSTAGAEHQRLFKFYGVMTLSALADAQSYHIEKLQSKLPANPSFAPNRVREG